MSGPLLAPQAFSAPSAAMVRRGMVGLFTPRGELISGGGVEHGADVQRTYLNYRGKLMLPAFRYDNGAATAGVRWPLNEQMKRNIKTIDSRHTIVVIGYNTAWETTGVYSTCFAIPYRNDGTYTSPYVVIGLHQYNTGPYTMGGIAGNDGGGNFFWYTALSGVNAYLAPDAPFFAYARAEGAMVGFDTATLVASAGNFSNVLPIGFNSDNFGDPCIFQGVYSSTMATSARWYGTIAAVAVFNRALDTGEMLRIQDDPSLLFEEPRLHWLAEGTGAPVSLAGQADGSATTSAALGQIKTLTAQADGSATATGALAQIKLLAGQADGSATATGALGNVVALAGTSDGGSSVSAALGKDTGLSGASDGSGTAAGALVEQIALAGQSDGSATTAADLQAGDPTFTGHADGVGTAAGALAVNPALAGQSDGGSSTAAALARQVGLAGQSDGSSSATGDLSDTDTTFAASSAGSSTASGALSVQIGLAASSAGGSSTAAAVSRQVALAGQSDGSSTAGAALTLQDTIMAGFSQGVGSATGALSVQLALAGQSDGSSGTEASLFGRELMVEREFRRPGMWFDSRRQSHYIDED